MMIQRKQDMMSRMLKRAARARSEHGIALLFTLCILSMALITAMILSSESTTSRKVASVHVDSTAARILADGVVGRAIIGLMHSDTSYAVSSATAYKTLSAYRPKNTNLKEYGSDWIWKLENNGVFTFNDGPIRFHTTYYNLDSDSSLLCPSWEYVFGYPYGVTVSSKNERIYGRYAYVAIGHGDQLNPNALGRRTTASEPDYDASIYNKRLGRYTSEPQFVFKSGNGWDYSNSTPKIDSLSIASNYSTLGGSNWTEQDIFDDVMVPIDSSLPANERKRRMKERMMVNQYFDVAAKPDYNKFSPTGKAVLTLTKHECTDDEMYRFPLIRTDWNTIGVNEVKAAVPWFGSYYAADQTIANLINYNAKFDRAPVSNADWRTGEPAYTGNKRTPYINEVSAEIEIGGVLGFRLPKKDVQPDPINNPSLLKWRIMYTDCHYSHLIKVNVETVNMFKGIKTSISDADDGYSAYPVSTPVLFGGEITYEYWIQNSNNAAAGSGSWKKVTLPFEKFSTDTDVTVTKIGDDNSYQNYAFVLKNDLVDSFSTPWLDNNGNGYDKPIGHDGDFYRFMRIKNVKVNLDRIILYDTTGRNADLALMPDVMKNGKTFCDSGSDEDEITCGSMNSPRRFYLHAQVNDPRFNLGRDQWTDASNQFISKDFLADSIGARNDISTGTYHDNEDKSGYDPAYNSVNPISTAYIRHGQMISLWELGAIHRGAPWQTINLKCASNSKISMDGYEFGDGHLLDQVALATRTDRAEDKVFGMIDLNCVVLPGNPPFTFRSLFTGFPIYQTFERMNDSNPQDTLAGSAVDSVDSNADLYAIELATGVKCAVDNDFAPRRTAVLPETFPAGSVNPMDRIIPKNVPDAQSEEVFCRVVNLLKWNKQQTRRATIIVLAQTIKDVGGDISIERVLPDSGTALMHEAGYQVFNDTNNRTTDLSDSAVRGESGSMSGSYKKTVAFKSYENLYDQITGEAKLIVHMEWDETANGNKGAWKVTRKEYAE